MRYITTLLITLIAPWAYGAISISSATPDQYRGQLEASSELLTVEGGSAPFTAIQNRSQAPDLLGGAIILAEPDHNWINQTRQLRLGLARQGWDLITGKPDMDPEIRVERNKALIEQLRQQGNKRILVIALGNQAKTAISLLESTRDLRLVMFNASSDTQAQTDLEQQVELLSKTRTVELYTRSPHPSEAQRRHWIAKKRRLQTYKARAMLGPVSLGSELNRSATKHILGAIKTLIIEFEQRQS